MLNDPLLELLHKLHTDAPRLRQTSTVRLRALRVEACSALDRARRLEQEVIAIIDSVDAVLQERESDATH